MSILNLKCGQYNNPANNNTGRIVIIAKQHIDCKPGQAEQPVSILITLT